jgi:hypothetical protein
VTFLRKFKVTAVALFVSLGLSSGAATAATYNPVGVQNDVSVTTVADGGWSVLYQGLHRDTRISLADIFAGAGDLVMLASRRVGASSYDVLATIETSVFVNLQTARDQTITANGALWYQNGWSMGFAGLGDTIRQNSADTQGRNERDRLSWHTNIGVAGRSHTQAAQELSFGWRSGNNTGLNGSTQWERVILTADVAAVPVPAALPLMMFALGGLVTLRRRKS